MDKFLLLTRSYLGATFRYLAKSSWAAEPVSNHTDLLSSIPLAPSDSRLPNGLRYHVIDIYLYELDKADRPRSGTLSIESIIAPLRKLEKESPTKPLRERAKEALNDPRIPTWNEKGSDEDSGNSMEDEEA